MSKTPDQIRAEEKARLTARPGETVRQFIRRMHGNQRPACTCPTAYSMCKYAVMYAAQKGDRSGTHGGWGWPTYWDNA